jgi:hypothetical protein
MARRRKYGYFDKQVGCGCLLGILYLPFGVIFELAKKYK